MVRREDEPLLKDLWIKLYNTYVNTTSDYYWEIVCEELMEPKDKI